MGSVVQDCTPLLSSRSTVQRAKSLEGAGLQGRSDAIGSRVEGSKLDGHGAQNQVRILSGPQSASGTSGTIG